MRHDKEYDWQPPEREMHAQAVDKCGDPGHRVVHRVGLINVGALHAEERLVRFACGTGWRGLDQYYAETDAPVTCKRCLRTKGGE